MDNSTSWLSFGKVRLRALELDDVQALYKLENDSSAWIYGCNTQPVSVSALTDYVLSAGTDVYKVSQLRLAICVDGDDEPVGMIDLYDFDHRNSRAWVGVIVREDMRKKGIASDALSALCNYSFGFLHLHTLLCYVPVSNLASFNLFCSAGFTNGGVLVDYIRTSDGYEDVHILQKFGPDVVDASK